MSTTTFGLENLESTRSKLGTSDKAIYEGAVKTYLAVAAVANDSRPLAGARPTLAQVEAALNSLYAIDGVDREALAYLARGAIAAYFGTAKSERERLQGARALMLEGALGKNLYRIMRGRKPRRVEAMGGYVGLYLY